MTSPACVDFHTPASFITAACGCPPAPGRPALLLIDGAREPRLDHWVSRRPDEAWFSLTGAKPGTTLFARSPLLVELPPGPPDLFVTSLLNPPAHPRAASVLHSSVGVQELGEHMRAHLYVSEADGTTWGLAIWDPFVLAALAGSARPINALVTDPILRPAQIASLLTPFECWAFRHRDGLPCAIALPLPGADIEPPPFVIEAWQWEQLVDLPIPDRVAELLRQSYPELREDAVEEMLLRFCATAIRECRTQGRDGLAAYSEWAAKALSEALSERGLR